MKDFFNRGMVGYGIFSWMKAESEVLWKIIF